MASEYTLLLKEKDLKDNGRRAFSMDDALRPCYEVPSMKESSTWVTKKAKASTHLRMDQCMTANGSQTSRKDMENSSLKTECSTMDSGKRTKCMDTVSTYTAMG